MTSPAGLVHGPAGPARTTQGHGSHFEQLDESQAARQDAVALEQGLPFDGIERRILRQRIHQILIRNG